MFLKETMILLIASLLIIILLNLFARHTVEKHGIDIPEQKRHHHLHIIHRKDKDKNEH